MGTSRVMASEMYNNSEFLLQTWNVLWSYGLNSPCFPLQNASYLNIIRLLGHFKVRQRLRQNNFIVESAVKKKTLMTLMRN